MTDQILALPDVLAITRVSRATLYATLLAKQDFPKPFKLGLSKNAWLRSEVTAWIEQRAAQRH